MASAPPQPNPREESDNSGQRYKDKVCVVTGGASGIGEGIVRVFVQNGAKVAICDKNQSRGESIASEVTQKGPGEAVMITSDLTVEDDIKNFMAQVLTKFERIDCLVNNAGWHPPYQSIDESSSSDFKKLMDLNLLGYFLTCKYALPHLRKTQGNVINISSLVAHIGQIDATAYVATKGAVTAMTRALAIEEARHNVRVNVVTPGNIWTPLWEEVVSQCDDKEAIIQSGRDSQLLGRFGTPEEIGKLCLFLAADGTYMTGADVMCTGGAELDFGKKSKLGSTSGGAFN